MKYELYVNCNILYFATKQRNNLPCRPHKILSSSKRCSRVPALSDSLPITELEELKADPEEGHVNPGEMDPGESVTLVQNLRDSGFKIRTPFSKASYRQASVESSIRIFQRTLKLSVLPGETPLTAISFSKCVKLSTQMLNLRPICIIPSAAGNPDKLKSVSPATLHSPDSATWIPLGAARKYKGQMALIAQQQHNFCKMWKLYHPRKICSNHNMSEVGAGSLGDICLIHNLSKNSGRRSTFPALGKIVKFLDDNKSQAEQGKQTLPLHHPRCESK